MRMTSKNTIQSHLLSPGNCCAVVILYNGADTILETLDALSKNVETIIVVDNHSTDESITLIRELTGIKNLHIIMNDSNVGIATALNIGVRKAKELGFQWAFTMDQDSILIDQGLVEMGKVFELLQIPERDKVICLAAIPQYSDNVVDSSNSDSKSRGKYFNSDYVITSGNLVNIQKLNELGWYNDQLFIDSVDFDFCLRAKELGYTIVSCVNARMRHQLGDTTKISFLGLKIGISVHSKIRKYYMSRNHIYILMRFWRVDFKFCLKKTLFFHLFLLQILLFEKQKLASLRMVFIGLMHGFQGKFGKLNQLKGGSL